MSNKKSDSTRRDIENQFFKLLKEKRIDEIRVTEITDALNIHRTTFYNYFDSVYSLAESLEKEFFSIEGNLFPGSFAREHLQHIRDTGNAENFAYLIKNPDHEPAFESKMRRIRYASLIKFIDDLHISYEEKDLPFYTTFILDGINGLINFIVSGETDFSNDDEAYIVDELLINTLTTIDKLIQEVRKKENKEKDS